MPTRKFLIRGEPDAQEVARALIVLSRWFALTPYPDDEWLFEVKSEAGWERPIAHVEPGKIVLDPFSRVGAKVLDA